MFKNVTALVDLFHQDESKFNVNTNIISWSRGWNFVENKSIYIWNYAWDLKSNLIGNSYCLDDSVIYWKSWESKGYS
jgi:hypothetical protein